MRRLRLVSIFAIGLILALNSAVVWGGPFSGAGDVGRGMDKAAERRQEARLRQLRIQEANRNARIQYLEYQIRLRELEAQLREVEAQKGVSAQPSPQIGLDQRRDQNVGQIATTASLTSVEVATNLQHNAPFEVADGLVLTEARAPVRDVLFIHLKLVDFEIGLSGTGPTLPPGSEHAFLIRISCDDRYLYDLMRSGATVHFNLYDKNLAYLVQRRVRFADCSG